MGEWHERLWSQGPTPHGNEPPLPPQQPRQALPAGRVIVHEGHRAAADPLQVACAFSGGVRDPEDRTTLEDRRYLRW
jgi:hypothetical protein